LLQSHVDAPTPAPAPADDDDDDDGDGGGGGPSRSGRRARASDAVSPGAAPPPRWRDGASFAPPLPPPGAIPAVAVDAPAVVPAVAVVAAAGGVKEGEDAGSLLPPGPNSVGIGSRVCGARFIYSL
jgi:hypothetical protein